MADPEYCRRCGARANREIPQGDDRERCVCPQCSLIQYDNPNNVVGCLLSWQGKVLLCKRSIEPRLGYWTLPAGFMENGETLMDGALREAREEANASGEYMRLFAVYSLPRISQVYVMFCGELADGKASAGDESLEVQLFAQSEIPWDDLAFPVVTETLVQFFAEADSRTGARQVHSGDILSRPGSPLEIVRHPG